MKLLIVLFVCIVAAECAKRPKPPKQEKTVKQLKYLCSAYESSYVKVEDSTFDDIFSDDMLGNFCDDFFDALNETAKPVFRYVDGIKSMSKSCKSYNKKYNEEPEEGPLVGFEAICNATKSAAAMTLNDRVSKRALASLTKLCEAQDADKLRIKISNFTDVFEDLEDFCDVYMNETLSGETKRRGDYVDGIKELGNVCRWYSKKFNEYEAEGDLALLEPICEDYEEVKMALAEEEEEEE